MCKRKCKFIFSLIKFYKFHHRFPFVLYYSGWPLSCHMVILSCLLCVQFCNNCLIIGFYCMVSLSCLLKLWVFGHSFMFTLNCMYCIGMGVIVHGGYCPEGYCPGVVVREVIVRGVIVPGGYCPVTSSLVSSFYLWENLFRSIQLLFQHRNCIW